ncbi:Uncharacterized protein TPAR_06071 [Tolypocladium paradoxum]|uniref:Mmc1 C-terminal domain-containing protein n=1 Tax=Tolypocladium paradoxum TaxID=94208 RepID=A0A2S4KU76_9HYPO|nr:Uncharacterized protein TPAR_06071 [Tolypocladium paradoxum]
MASKTTLLPRSGQRRLLLGPGRRHQTPICPFCSFVPRTSGTQPRTARHDVGSRRWQSTTTTTATTTSTDPRVELERTLLELQTRAPNLVNLSRLQLALQGLRQSPGEEVVRVAILGLGDGGSGAGPTARRVLGMLLADPLVDEEAWERELEAHDPSRPLIVRVAPSRGDVGLELSTDTALHELHVSSPELNGFNLELLLMDVSAPYGYGAPGAVSIQALEDAVLVPTVDVPSVEDRVSPVTTPVHQALLVADGLMGAVNVSALPVSESSGSIKAAVQMEGVSKQQLQADFDVIDVSLAEQGVQLFRQGPQHAMDYERLWFASNLPALTTWLKAGARSTERATKPAVRQLIASLLRGTISSIQAEQARKLWRTPATQGTSPPGALDERLAEWAQHAHAELQDELDLAFTGRRWRKLGWWKLFWRVDDVAMLTNEMLSQRFMPTAEQELVYLTGRIAELGGDSPTYPQPVSSRDGETPGSEKRRLGSGEHAPAVAATASSALPKWPGHIAFTRRYLQNETVPALQSLAQKLVMQSLGTSGITTSLAALLYVSSLASSLYEAGAVAALGIVYSLGRMQKKWETARGFWEGEVREEGRKAVRAAEASVATVLEDGGARKAVGQQTEELQKARDLVARAEDALARMK